VIHIVYFPPNRRDRDVSFSATNDAEIIYSSTDNNIYRTSLTSVRRGRIHFARGRRGSDTSPFLFVLMHIMRRLLFSLEMTIGIAESEILRPNDADVIKQRPRDPEATYSSDCQIELGTNGKKRGKSYFVIFQ